MTRVRVLLSGKRSCSMLTKKNALPRPSNDARDHDRPALAHAVLVEDELVLRQVVPVLK